MGLRSERVGTGTGIWALLVLAMSACDGRSDRRDLYETTAGAGGSVAGATGGSISAGGSGPAGTSSGGDPSSGGNAFAGAGAGQTGGSGATASGGDSGADGGAIFDGGAAGSSSGGASGGSPSDGGATGGGGSSQGGSDPGGTPWCPQLDVCKYGADERLAPGEECPEDRECYSDEWCGKTVQCVKFEGEACTDTPSCDPGQLKNLFCMGVGICETRSACGKSIVCETLHPGGSECQPGVQKDRVFAALPEKCGTIAIHCPRGSAPFSDECGCGCEQPEDCPDWVDCQPGAEDPRQDLCDSVACPFTQRSH